VPVLRHPLSPRLVPGARRIARVAAVVGVLLAAVGPAALPAAAADGPTMEARVLLGGHARVGSWVAISVHLRNDGPAIDGELRIAGGTQSQTRFSVPADLPTQADKTFVLYAQPPAFGTDLQVLLVEGDRTVTSVKATYASDDGTQLVVAVIAEHPERIVGNLHLLPNQNQVAPLVMSLVPEDLPERVEAWTSVDRMIWQDIDATRLTTAQLAALRSWVAAGGRLVIAGGTTGPKALAAFPDALLPYRPSVTTDVPAASLTGILGELPPTATTLPALSGELIDGRALAVVGDRVVAAERAYGAGSVTLLGFDPSVDWIAKTDSSQAMWRRLLPARTFGALSFFDDNLLIGATSQLPSLSLPPTGGLILLLLAYIALIGPINYLVLRRLDRREWAWLTMPVLIVVFAVGAYAYGAALRGSEVIVNEIAIVRGTPGTSDGSAQVYLGVFSPSRRAYQVSVPGGALLSAPINGDNLSGTGTGPAPTVALDIVQGDPARVRELQVGFGALRTIRAETAVAVPLIETDLRFEDGRLQGTIRNASSVRLEHPAIVLGQTVALLKDIEPGAVATVDTVAAFNPFGQTLSDRVVGNAFFTDTNVTPEMTQSYVRRSMVDQLTYDPMMGSTNLLSADGPVLLAWGSNALVPVDIEGQEPRRLGTVLYYLPTGLAIKGTTTFHTDLLRSTVVASDAQMFTKDPTSMSFGRGSATVAYRPIAFDGHLKATKLTIGMNFGDPGAGLDPPVIQPLPSIPPACPQPPTPDCAPAAFDGVPEVELFDTEAQVWRRLPHLAGGNRVAVADPQRFVDPTSGTVLVRYVNDRTDGVGFQVDIALTGTVE
jgi:hypothetical protein